MPFAAGTSDQAQPDGVGAGPVNAGSAITGQTGRKDIGRAKSRRGTMTRPRSRTDGQPPRGVVVGAA